MLFRYLIFLISRINSSFNKHIVRAISEYLKIFTKNMSHTQTYASHVYINFVLLISSLLLHTYENRQEDIFNVHLVSKQFQ